MDCNLYIKADIFLPLITFIISFFKVTAHAGPRLSRELPFGPIPAKTLRKEYSNLECTIELVDDVDDAISHIESHGSSHTDAIITENGSLPPFIFDFGWAL